VSFLRDSAYSMAARIWMAAARGLCIVAISRALGPADYGTYALVLNTFVIAVLAGTMGLEQACTFTASKEPERIAQMVRNAPWLALFLGVAAILMFGPIARLFQGRIFDPQAVRLVWEALIFVPFAILNNQFAGLAAGSGWFRYYAKTETFKWTLYLALSMLLVLLHRLDVRTGLLAFYAAVSVTALIHWKVFAARYRTAGVRPRGLDLVLARQVLAYGMKVFSTSVVNLLNFRFDLYLVKYFRTPGEVGMYSLGMNLAEVLLYGARSVNLVIFSRVSADERRSNHLTPAVSRLLLAGITAAVFVILVVKDAVIMKVFGDRFATCSNVVTLLLPGILAQSLTLLLVGDFLGKQDLGVVLYSGLLCFAVMVGLDLWWIPMWGVLGAAGASAIAYASQTALLLHRHASGQGLGVARYLLAGRDDWNLLRGRLRAARSGGVS